MKHEVAHPMMLLKEKCTYAFEHAYVQEHAFVQKTYSRRVEIMRNIRRLWKLEANRISHN